MWSRLVFLYFVFKVHHVIHLYNVAKEPKKLINEEQIVISMAEERGGGNPTDQVLRYIIFYKHCILV